MGSNIRGNGHKGGRESGEMRKNYLILIFGVAFIGLGWYLRGRGAINEDEAANNFGEVLIAIGALSVGVFLLLEFVIRNKMDDNE